jgi:ubiquilin
MMNSPEFLQQMSSLMSNPAVLDQALALNPQYAAMGPQAREIFQSERFRQMMFAPPFHLGFSCRAKPLSRSNPDSLRGMIQMASMMRGAGFDPMAGPFGGSTPVAPGNPNAPPISNTTSTTTTPVGGPAPGGARCYSFLAVYPPLSFLAVYPPLRTHVLLRSGSRFNSKCAISLCATLLG